VARRVPSPSVNKIGQEISNLRMPETQNTWAIHNRNIKSIKWLDAEVVFRKMFKKPKIFFVIRQGAGQIHQW